MTKLTARKIADIKATLATMTPDQIKRITEYVKQGNGESTIKFDTSMTTKQINAVFTVFYAPAGTF